MRVAAAAISALYWTTVLKAPDEIFTTVFGLFHRGENLKRFDNAWEQFLTSRLDYVPDYWRFHLFVKSYLDRGTKYITATIDRCLARTNRQDLEPLFSIYARLLVQTELPSLSGSQPLAQSLWIGPRLRWIENMCIRSFLRNGWRFEL
uniref:Uncharacterized protein n=1 Tax=Candidatus Kentrum sp. FW TaxID=2126338 RepID=A0A450TYF9_9GAMM|nr:MAG: hypothetical protein BECKFW1821C_GA0114237_106322 [Candidatus Kentron sp. FW]